MTPLPGPLALVGSGEFLPAMIETDGVLLADRPARVAVIPTAAAPEGEGILRRWFSLAERHYQGLGAEVVQIDVRDRAAADDPGVVGALHDVGLVYLSGGNPGFLVETLRGTALAAAIAAAWRAGAALAGCSAGAMALGATTLTMRGPTQEGLGLAGPIAVVPHFDRFGFAQRLISRIAACEGRGRQPDTGVGIDEDTAVVWLPDRAEWVVHGKSRTWVLGAGPDERQGFAAGEVVPLPSPALDV